jgi:hypothetical protein
MYQNREEVALQMMGIQPGVFFETLPYMHRLRESSKYLFTDVPSFSKHFLPDVG